jgi:hypothetical protein
VLLAIVALVIGDRLVGLRKLADFKPDWRHEDPGRQSQHPTGVTDRLVAAGSWSRARHRVAADDGAPRRALHRHARRSSHRRRGARCWRSGVAIDAAIVAASAIPSAARELSTFPWSAWPRRRC